MRKYSSRTNAFFLIFFVGIGTCIVWASIADVKIETVKSSRLSFNQDCAETPDFPGLSKKISETERIKDGYFPKGAFAIDNRQDLDDFASISQGKFMKTMQETTLLDISDEKKEIYRFVWSGFRHNTIFVQLERNQKEIKLFTKELKEGGSKEILRNFNRELTETEWCNFLKSLRKTDYWNLSIYKSEDFGGKDGSSLMLEGVKNGRYHVVLRRSPSETGYREACLYLLKLSGVDIDKLGNDLY